MATTIVAVGLARTILAAAIAFSLVTPGAVAQTTHSRSWPIVDAAPPGEIAALANLGVEIERDRAAPEMLADHRRLDAALAAVRPQHAGAVEAFVVVAALDSDPVFAREARETGRVLGRRYHAAGHGIVLAGSDRRGGAAMASGSPTNLALALARVAEVMGKEDVLVLYLTSHGAPFGIVYNDGDQGIGAVSPMRLWTLLWQLGIENRLLIVSACYAGAFVPTLASDTTAIITASSAERTSFGCRSDNDWTFFGDALVNHALRNPVPLADAAGTASTMIAGWEREGGLVPSEPQVSIGAGAARWLSTLEAGLPAATAPTGRPATDALTK